jgi:hypothetical protein
MIYEQRIYTCLPGRLPALLKRFEGHTLKLWEKHGIRQAGFWTVLIGNGNHDLHYRPDPRQHQEHDFAADRVLGRQVRQAR